MRASNLLLIAAASAAYVHAGPVSRRQDTPSLLDGTADSNGVAQPPALGDVPCPDTDYATCVVKNVQFPAPWYGYTIYTDPSFNTDQEPCNPNGPLAVVGPGYKLYWNPCYTDKQWPCGNFRPMEVRSSMGTVKVWGDPQYLSCNL